MKEKKASSKSSKRWVCPENCLLTNTPCIHLRKLLPWDPKDTMNVKRLAHELWHQLPENTEKNIDNLKLALKRLNFDGEETDLLIDKYVSNLSLDEIARDRGYSSVGGLHRRLSRLVKQLQQIGKERVKQAM